MIEGCLGTYQQMNEERRRRLTHAIQQSPKHLTSSWMTLDDSGCEHCQCDNEANLKFLLLGMFLVGNGAPCLFIVKEVRAPFFRLFPTIEY